MTDRAVSDDRSGARSGGPHPGVLAVVSLGIFLASLAAIPVVAGGKWFVSPFAPAADVAEFFRQYGVAAEVAGMLQFGSAVPLGIFAATAYARQLRLGVRVPGPAIGFFGGISAAVFLMLSGSSRGCWAVPKSRRTRPLHRRSPSSLSSPQGWAS